MKIRNNNLEKHTALSAFSSIALLAGAPVNAQTYLSQTATKMPRPTDEIKFESQSVSNSFINIENGPLVVTPIKEEAWSSRWYVEPVGEGDFVRIKNRWTGCYLNMEQGPLVCGPQQAGWWSAQWRLVPDVDVKYSIINRWTDCKLTNSGQGLRCMKNDTKTADNLWRPINLTPATPFKRRPIKAAPPAPPPVQASEPPPAPEIDRGGTVVFLSTDGAFPDKLLMKSGKSFSLLQTEFDEDIEVILISGRYTKVIGYEERNFRGRTITLTCGGYELIGDPENEIRSIKVIEMDRPAPSCPGSGAEHGPGIWQGFNGAVEIHNWDQ